MNFTNRYFSLFLTAVLFTACIDSSLNSKPVSPSPTSQDFPVPSETPAVQPHQDESKEILAYKTETFAGSGIQGHRDGNLLEAQFTSIRNACFNPKTQEMYLLDNHRIRKITPQKTVVTIAGSDKPGYKDGVAEQSLFSYPQDCLVEPNGNLLILDQFNQRIRKLSPDGFVSTFAGNGNDLVQDGFLTSTSFSYLQNITIFNGQVIVSDGFRLRKINQDSIFTLNHKQTTSNEYGGPKPSLPIDSIEGRIEDVYFGSRLLLSKLNDNILVIADMDLGLLFTLNEKNEIVHIIPDRSDFSERYGYFPEKFNDIATYKNQLIVADSNNFQLLEMSSQKPKISDAAFLDEHNELQFTSIQILMVLEDKNEMYYFNSGTQKIEKIILTQPQKMNLPS